jgi:oligoendopeptidase F
MPIAQVESPPPQIDPSDFAQIEPLYRALLERPITSCDDLEQLLLDSSALESVLNEYGAKLYIESSCHTEDSEIEKRYLHWIEEIEPKIKPVAFELQKKVVASPYKSELNPDRYFVLIRAWENAVSLYRPENIPLETDATKLYTDYGKINGSMTIDFRGQTRTMQQMAKFLEETDRGVREQAWKLIEDRRLKERTKIEDIYEKMLVVRQAMAKNAGFDDYRSFTWKSRERFDYSPEDCLRFSRAIEETVVPLVKELDRTRRAAMKVETLRPWDLGVDIHGRQPLRPFGEREIPLFVKKVRTIFTRLSPALGDQFGELKMGVNLDLDSRKGKRPGGYQSSLEASKQPFIFMNAVGTHGDLDTLLHEAGHAFHYMAARHEPLVYLRSAPLEFCEVASMAMELLGADHLDVFYNDADAARAKRQHLEGIVRFLPWMAIIDSFQHWIYTHPGHLPEARTGEWLRLQDRFSSPAVDWSGFEAARASRWQRQLHLFGYPFYYIEYGIAQLGALQLWVQSKTDTAAALAGYRRGLALGGRRPLPELFAATGIRFDFSAATLGPLMEAVQKELRALPE